jgi:DNA-binding MarR family transcriptional regulator
MPRIARAEGPAATGSPMRSVAIRAEISRVMQQQRAKDDESISVSRRSATAQQERDRLIAEDAPAAEISAARELVERLRREQDELVGVRAHLTAKSRALRTELVPIESEELTHAALVAIGAVDSPIRQLGRALRPLVPVMAKALAAQRIAERQLSAAQNRGGDLHLIADAAPDLDRLTTLAAAVIDHAQTTTAPTIERNHPAEAGTVDASPSPSPVSAA